MNRALRRRENRRTRLIEAGQITERIVWRILNGWQREAEYRARVAFVGGESGDNAQDVPAVWDLKDAKLAEAQRFEQRCPEVPAVEELHEYCRRAIAKYTERSPLNRSIVGPGLGFVGM